METISYISDNVLCTACGACAGICPSNAIQIEVNTAGYLQAKINNDMCIHCQKCTPVCPSNPENKPALNVADIFYGNCLAGYVGYATDPGIRKKSQSGGVVTALLCYLLDMGKIDGAVVNHFNKDTQRPEVTFVTSKDEIIAGCGSYYAQSSVIKTILEIPPGKISAAVVLGCQAMSLQLTRERYPKVQLPTYTLGLVCEGQYSGSMIDDLISQTPCNAKKADTFRFKEKGAVGWPGDVHISANQNDYWLPKEKRFALKPVYELHRCIACFDHMNIFSDIVCGDPWGISNKQQPEGNTVVITRTEQGEKLVQDAVKEGFIILEPLPPVEILRGETVDGRLKTKFFTSRDIFSEKKWVFPFPNDMIKDIPYTPANEREYRDIREGLEYTREIYQTTDQAEYNKKTNLKKKKLLPTNIQKMKMLTAAVIRKIL